MVAGIKLELVAAFVGIRTEERARKREALLIATETDLARIRTRVARANNPLHGSAEIGRAVGAVIGKRKMAKHFAIEITDETFGFARKYDQIDAEALLDGICVLRTNLMSAGVRPGLRGSRPYGAFAKRNDYPQDGHLRYRLPLKRQSVRKLESAKARKQREHRRRTK